MWFSLSGKCAFAGVYVVYWKITYLAFLQWLWLRVYYYMSHWLTNLQELNIVNQSADEIPHPLICLYVHSYTHNSVLDLPTRNPIALLSQITWGCGGSRSVGLH